MLGNLKEEDFKQLYYQINDRLSPVRMSIFSVGALVLSGVIWLVANFSTGYSIYITNPIWPYAVKALLVLLVIQACFTLFFLKEVNAYRFQLAQSMFTCIISFKISIETYFVYFAVQEDRRLSEYTLYYGFIAMAGGFILLLVSLIRTQQRIKAGHFRKGGGGMFADKQSKGFLYKSLVFALVMMAGIHIKIPPYSNSFADTWDAFIVLCFSVFMQYGLALAWPEFLFMAYCKRRFESFRAKKLQPRKKKGIQQ